MVQSAYMKREVSAFELDPSYDPERLEGSRENIVETGVNMISSSPIPIKHIEIHEYVFNTDLNPFAWDAENQQPIDRIANAIDEALKQSFSMNGTIVRGVQSGHHELNRDDLVSSVISNGSDIYLNIGNEEIFAKEFTDDALKSILSGFHVFKPKSEERPQYPVDVWMIFDKNTFENIEYLHPRHNTIARDKWRLKDSRNNGLRGILVIN